MILDVTILAAREGHMLSFTFLHEGKQCYCYPIADQRRPLPFVVGQKVRIEGQWSESVQQVFEAVKITAVE